LVAEVGGGDGDPYPLTNTVEHIEALLPGTPGCPENSLPALAQPGVFVKTGVH